MALRIVRLGTPRVAGEGLRIGTVRRPPRGVPKSEFASRDFYDVWYPVLAPSVETMKIAQQAQAQAKEGDGAATWRLFVRRFKAEMASPDAAHTLDLLAALSHRSDFSVGCYCADEARCHRSVLRALLSEREASFA